MKKLFTFLAISAISASLFSQSSFQLLDPDNSNADVTGATFDFYGAPGEDIIKIIDVKNNAASNKTVKLKRTFVSGVAMTSPEDTCTICWNVCLPWSANLTQTTGNVNIGAGSIASFQSQSGLGFHSSFKSNSTLGTRVVRYTWYDVNNTNDSTYLIVNYHITGVNIKENVLKQFNFSNPQPNPAIGSTSIKYDFPHAAKAKIKIYNAIGTLMKEVRIDDENGKITISTEELSNGVYFYSLLVNDKIVGTKRLIVAN